jgi:hypothetical protein
MVCCTYQDGSTASPQFRDSEQPEFIDPWRTRVQEKVIGHLIVSHQFAVEYKAESK